MNAPALQPAAAPTVTPTPNPRDRYRGPKADRMTLLALQRSMFDLAQNPAIPAHIRAQCARTWRDLQETKRIIDGKPLPGQLRPDLEQRKNARRSKPLLLPEPIAETQAPAVAPQEKPA